MKTALGILINLYLIFTLVITVYLSNSQTQSHDNNRFDTSLDANINTQAVDYGDVPNFLDISNTQEKKQRFFNYFAPIVADENRRILNHRKQLSLFSKKLQRGKELNADNIKQLDQYATFYKTKTKTKTKTDRVLQIENILERANAVPISLALAQAANESAWGTSRFARDGNNFFGQWCFNKGCGLVPKHREESSSHEVRVFSSPADSVKAYIRNINTHAAYDDLRQLRAQAESEGLFASGSLLAEGLLHYSERGHEYVAEIQAMIQINQLESFEPSNQIGTL